MSKSRHVPYHAEAYPLPWGFNGALAMPYRWLSGRPMNGHRYTNATGFRYGTAALDPSGYANTYQLLPGYKRFLYARLPIMLAPAAGVGVVVAPEHMAVSALGVSTLAAWRLDGYRRTRRFRRQVIEPVAAGVARVMREEHIKGRGHRWVTIGEDFRDNPDALVKINLPTSWIAEEGDKARLVRLVSERLNLDELDASWTWAEGVHSVSLAMPPKPPKRVDMATGILMASTVADDELAMGMGTRESTVSFSLSGDSPHLLIAGGTGAGKSELLAYLVGQLMRRGYGVAVLDAKFTSHMWLRRVPGVLYASEGEELHEALIWLDAELMRRAREISKGADPDSFQPIVALLEEMNGASNRLRAYWSTIKETGQPQMSPALTALANLASMGRELRMHILMAGQSLTAKSVGGPEGRENFAGRALGRATSAQWRMLAPQIKPAPVKRQGPGRWHLVVGDRLQELQVPFLDIKRNEGAHVIEWATSGAPVPDVPAMMALGVATTEEPRIPSSEVVTPAGISLRQYAEEAGLSLATLRKWADRPDFPSWVGIGANRTRLYDRDHLRDYARGRLREPVTLEE